MPSSIRKWDENVLQFEFLSGIIQGMTLILLAAGMGSRFGGPKQFVPVGPNGECLIHFAIEQAQRAGFDSFILLTRDELVNESRLKIIERLPTGFPIEIRTQPTPNGKPRGTGAAVLSCRDSLQGSFAVCNGDDFYGESTFVHMHSLMEEYPGLNQAVMAPFLVENTLSENGGGSRAKLDFEGDKVHSLIELRDVQRHQDRTIWGRSDDGIEYELAEGTPVSMNIFGFNMGVFGPLVEYQSKLEAEGANCEIGLPQFLNWAIGNETIDLRFRISQEQWFGLTFPDDLEIVKSALLDTKKVSG